MKFTTLTLILAIVVFVSTAQGAELLEISSFAKDICDDIRPEGTITRQEIAGKLDAEARGIAKLLGLSVGVDGKLRHDKTEYKGLPFEKIAGQMQSARECRLQVTKMLIDERARLDANKPLTFKTCRHPDFGRVGWQYSDVVNRSSGWRGGGSSPASWCSELKNLIVREKGLGRQHEMKVLGSSERHRRSALGHVTYNYSCNIAVNWDPIYDERTDPRCGTIK